MVDISHLVGPDPSGGTPKIALFGPLFGVQNALFALEMTTKWCPKYGHFGGPDPPKMTIFWTIFWTHFGSPPDPKYMAMTA